MREDFSRKRQEVEARTMQVTILKPGVVTYLHFIAWCMQLVHLTVRVKLPSSCKLLAYHAWLAT